MTLTALRRVVLVCNIFALGTVGWAGYEAFARGDVPLEKRQWNARFPTKATSQEVTVQGPGDWREQYMPVLEWKQGDKPVPPPPPDDTPKPPPVPAFQSKYSLRSVWIGPDLQSSSAHLVRGGSETIYVWVRGRIPGDDKWSLDNVHVGSDDESGSLAPGSLVRGTMRAIFVNVDSGERCTLEVKSSVGGDVFGKPNPKTGGGGLALTAKGDKATLPREAIPRPILVQSDAARGVYVWEIPEAEVDWWDNNFDEEARKVSTVASKDAEGRPNGVTLKAVPQSSRFAEVGLQAEDRVISVNDENVNSITQAIEVGKRQYDSGTGTFVVKVDRGGRVMNFTFKAAKKKQ